ncbi:MAG: hypothetical protein PVI26_07550 [Chitinispirillia bacterium]|jgi:hypothetical protein
MLYAKGCFHLKLIVLLIYMTESTVAQQMQLIIIATEGAGKPLEVTIKTRGFSGMQIARCTLHVDTAVLQSSEATIASCVSSMIVSGRFGSAADTTILTSKLIGSS